MAFSIIDPKDFLSAGIFREKDFFSKVDRHDWESYRNRQTLVRGCGTAIIPPWAFMHIVTRLSPVAKSIRYGSEHENIIIYRASKERDSV